LAGTRVPVEGRAVEAGKGPVVPGEVRRDPVDDDPDPRLVKGVDELPQAVRAAVAGGRGAIGGDLVAPRFPAWVLGDGISSTWVKPISATYAGRLRASSS
jgi:hypothetical protein